MSDRVGVEVEVFLPGLKSLCSGYAIILLLSTALAIVSSQFSGSGLSVWGMICALLISGVVR